MNPRYSLVLLLSLIAIPELWAHEVRPGYLELRQLSEEEFEVLWKRPSGGEVELDLRPVFPEECGVGNTDSRLTTGAVAIRSSLECEGGLAGKEIAIAGLAATLTDVLIRIHYLDGASETHLLRPISPSAIVGGSAGKLGRAGAYLTLGVEHIVLGIDHLLFVFGLLLIVSNRMMLLKTITSFTLAHSITLAVATLGYASAPLVPLNAAIALSMLLIH